MFACTVHARQSNAQRRSEQQVGNATNKGTPKKPVLGKAATRAPKDASFQRIRRFKLQATTKATKITPQNA
jgi:hypothetical protein